MKDKKYICVMFPYPSGDGKSIDLAKFKEQIDGYVESFKFNKVVSTWMEFYNKNKDKKINVETAEELKKIFRIFAPGFKK